MLPVKMQVRNVRAFEVITPRGHVHRFPRPGLLQRLAAFLRSNADLAAVATVIAVMLYVAGLAAEALQVLPFDLCSGETKPQATL